MPNISRKKPVDGEKLRAAVRIRGINMSDAAKKMGLEKSGISNWASRGEIPYYGEILLEKELGIPYEEYAPEQEREVPDVMGLNGRPCHYCQGNEETVYPVDVTEGKLNIAIAIMPKRKIMEIYANFGSENLFNNTQDTLNTMIHFCPFCGRQL